jgi:toxin ParE1/3/4
VEIVWSPLARARLREIWAHVAMDKPDAAAMLTTRITAMVESLRMHPYLGHMGTAPDSRELVVSGTPYHIFYRVRKQRADVTTIWHGARKR